MIAQENGSMARGGAKVVATSSAVDQRRYPNPDQPPRQRPTLSSSSGVRMFNKVQVVYYLTRNGHLEHPHYLEVSHLTTQPLRLKDIIDRLTVLRGKAMPCQYSWSCKRSYKNGFVWNDLSENDTIYASEGSEYVLKGSEIIHHTHFSGEIKEEGLQFKGRHQRQSSSSSYVKPEMNELVMNKSGGERHSFSFTQANTDNNNNNDEEDEEEEEKGSWKSSFSLPSTSSTNSSDKQQQQQQLQPPPPPPLTPPKQIIKPPISTVENEEGDRQLSRNTVLLQLIACGGGSVVAKAKSKPNNANKKFNFNGAMRSSNIIPCLKQQLSTRGGSGSTAAISRAARPSSVDNNDRVVVVSKEVQEDDEDMLMVRFMSENPRFGNLQSEEKEYFSGTIVEAMTTHSLQHGQGQPQPAVFTKSSSYNEQRSCKAGLQAAAGVDEDEEKEVVEVKGMISKCIPRTKSCLSNSSKSTNKC